MIVPDIAEYEEGDSYLAIKTISDLHTEIERLNKRVKECEEAYLRTRHQYSELETKYLTDEYIINELEKWLKDDNILVFDFTGSINKSEGLLISDEEISKKIQALKGNSSNE